MVVILARKTFYNRRRVVLTFGRRDILMQRSWLRLLVSLFIVVAALSAGATNAFDASGAHSCAEMTMTSDCPEHSDHAAIPRHCDSLICGAIQLTPILVVASNILTPTSRLLAPSDDIMRHGVASPPDLRPPIS